VARTYIQTDDIKDGLVTAPKMATDSVTTNALTDSAVTNPKLGSLSVSQLKIANEAVGTTQIEDSSITMAKLGTNSVGQYQIADSAVTGPKLDTTAKQAVLQYKKITAYVQNNAYAVAPGLTFVEVTSIVGLTTPPVSSYGTNEGILSDEPKNAVAIRNSYSGLPEVTNSLEVFGRITFDYPGITQWFVTFYTQAVGMTQTITPLPDGLTMMDWQYLQRYNMNTVDESFAADDKFFTGTVDVTEVLNINQLAKDIYTNPILNNVGNAILVRPLESQIYDIVNGLTTITPVLGPRSIPGLAIQINAITQLHLSVGSVGISQIENQAVTTNALADGSVTNIKLAALSVANGNLQLNSVATGNIQTSAITQSLIASGAVGLTQLEDQSVITAKLSDLAVTMPKIASGAVGLTQIEDQSIITVKLRDLAVTQAKIANAAVGTTQIENQSITSALIQDGSIINSKIGVGAVTSANIADGTVIAADIAPSAVDTLELSNSAVTNPKLAVNAVATTNITDSAVTNSKLVASAVTADKIASGQVVKTVAAYGGLTLTDNVNFVGGPAISITEQGISNAIKVDVLNLNLSQLSDVSLANPALNQVLSYNGAAWINGNPVNTSAGSGIVFFLNDVPSTDGNFTISPIPNAGAEQTDSAVVSASTALIEGYLSAALGRVQLDAGLWEFDVYRFVSGIGGTSTIVIQVLRKSDGVGTVAISGSGTSRTATITGATPFVAGNANADMALSGYVETPTQTFQITGFTSPSVVTVATPGGYLNESGVAYGIHRHLFNTLTQDINDTSVTLENVLTTQPAYTGWNSADRLSVRYYGRTTSGSSITISMTHDGLTNYSHFHTPLITRHNDLAGLQGGTFEQYYHLTASELNGLTTLEAGTSVIPGSYRLSDITVDSLGRVTTASTGVVGTTDITNLAVTQAKIANQAIGVTQIELQAIISNLIRDLAVTNSKLAPNSVTSDKIADGTVIAVDIAPSAVDTLELSNSAVTNPKLAVNAVTSTNITDSAVTNPKIAVGAVGVTQLENQSVTTAALRDGDVTQIKLATGAVGITQLENQAVTSAKIADLAVTNAKIAVGAVGITQLENQAVTTGKIANQAVTEAQIASGAVGTTEIQNQAITSALLRDLSVIQAKIANGAVGLTQIEDQSVTSAKIRDLNVTMPKIAAGAVGLTQFEDQSVITAKIRDLNVTQPKIAVGAVGLTQLATEVRAASHAHFVNVSPVSAPDGITDTFAFSTSSTPTSGEESVFINGVLRTSGALNDYTATYLANQLKIKFTFVPASTSQIMASGIFAV